MMAKSLTTPNYAKLSDAIKDEFNVVILNPLSNDLSVMRQSMLFSGLEAISYNINRKNAELKLYEFGKTYHKMPSGYDENKHLTMFISGNSAPENWLSENTKSSFFQFKGYLNTVFSRIGLENKLTTLPIESDLFSEGIALAIGKEIIVEFGTVKKSMLKHFDIKQDVLYADLKWDKIQKYVSNKIKFTDIPKYPEVRRDLALLVDEKVTFETVYNIAKQTEKKLLKDVNLFDVYQGEKLPEGKKSYAVSFIIQDENKTLNDKEIEKIMSKLQSNFENQLGAQLR
jgi:phenylalanyl-tRNA synthetase beta chain